MVFPRDQRVKELSRFMRMFIKTEHGPEAPCAHSFGLPSCKLNTSLFARAFQSIRQSCQGCVVGVISLDSPTAAEKAKFICLFIFCHAAFYCTQLLAGHERKTTHCIFIYGSPLPPTPTSIVYIFVRYKSSVPTSIFFRLWLLNFFPHL